MEKFKQQPCGASNANLMHPEEAKTLSSRTTQMDILFEEKRKLNTQLHPLILD